MSASQFDPVKEFASLRDSLSKALGQSIQTVAGNVYPLLDAYETDDAIIVRTAPLDNAMPDTIEVNVEGDLLTISGETQPDTDIPDDAYIQRERRFGRFARAIRLPHPIQSDRATARFKDGILTVTLPKAKDTRPNVVNTSPAQ